MEKFLDFQTNGWKNNLTVNKGGRDPLSTPFRAIPSRHRKLNRSHDPPSSEKQELER